MVWPYCEFRMQVWNVLHAAGWKYRTQKIAKNRHLGTIAQICRAISSQLRHVSTIGKKLLKQLYLLHASSHYGERRPTKGWDRFGCLGHPTSANFNGFRVLAVLLHGSLVVGVSQSLRRWTEGATYIRQDGNHVRHWPTFYSSFTLIFPFFLPYARVDLMLLSLQGLSVECNNVWISRII